MPEPLSLDRIGTDRYWPTLDADDFLEELRRDQLGGGERYRPARLALARSLHEQDPPPLVEKGTPTGKAIHGHTLFGAERGIWACLIAHSWPETIESDELFRAVVQAHWHRGAKLLRSDFQEARGSQVDFAVRIAAMGGLGTDAGKGKAQQNVAGSVQVTVRFGEQSIDLRQNTPVTVTLNEAGSSPHISVMGRIGSGKTRTGIDIAEQIFHQGKIPMIFIDPKGEFVKDGVFAPKPEWKNRTFADRFPGAQPLDVGRTPVPLDFLSLPKNPAPNALPDLASGFRDSVEKCIRAKGDVALDNLRQVVLSLLNANAAASSKSGHSAPISLSRILDALIEKNAEEDRGKDSIQARLGEMVDMKLFDPKMSPERFFSQTWVIGLSATNESAKKLVMFLVLDALASHILSQQDAPIDMFGNRQLRHLAVVDEAKEILSYRHGALSALLRKARSKGQVIMLLSQSPDDFDKEEDDFLSQMGTVGVFASAAQSVKSLRPVMGKKVRPEDLTDAALGKGVAFVKLPGRDPTKVLAWKP
jgi:DNA sulfur modification protein DndE